MAKHMTTDIVQMLFNSLSVTYTQSPGEEKLAHQEGHRELELRSNQVGLWEVDFAITQRVG